MLGSSLVFSTIMLVGMFFMPESPRFLMHKGKTLQAFDVWKRIRGTELQENREEFFVMKHSVIDELESTQTRSGSFAWLDFITVPRARRSIVYANIMIFLGQSALPITLTLTSSRYQTFSRLGNSLIIFPLLFLPLYPLLFFTLFAHYTHADSYKVNLLELTP